MATQQSAKFSKAGGHQFTDVGTILRKYFYHWPLFVLGLVIALSVAYAYMQVSNPVYEISATLLVKDEKKTPRDESALQELDQSSSPKIAESEIEILRSKNLVGQVIDELNLWVSYRAVKGLKTKDLYEAPPFRFLILTQKKDVKKRTFNILIKDAKSFELTNSVGEKQHFRFNARLKNNFGTWLLEPTLSLDEYIGATITITINDPEQVSNNYVKSLDAHLLDKTAPTIGLYITDEVPNRGKDFLNSLIKVYNQATSEEERRTTKNTIEFIDNRLASLTGELNHAEREVEGFRSSQGLTDINSQSKVFLENVQTNDNKLNEVNVQLNVIDGIERYVNSSSNSANTPATIGITDPALNSLIEKLSQLQLKKVALLATTPEDNPVFEPINRQIRIAKTAIKENIQTIKASLINTKRELQTFNNKFESSIRDIPSQERQFIGMKRQQAIKENLYVYLLQKREELSLSYASTIADARVIDQANVGDIAWPRPSLIFAIALLTGLGVPFLIVYFRDIFNYRITERRDLENALSIPVVAELSYEDIGKDIVIDNTQNILAEQFRALRTNIHYLHSNRTSTGRVTLITSSVSGEGKTFISSNLAASLAASGRKTIILEMDLRKPKVSKVFNLSGEKQGLSDFLASNIKEEFIIQRSGVFPELDVIGSGHIPPNPSELLEKDRLNELINYLKERYQDIIIDSPPLHLVTDAMIVGRVADICLYTVKQGHTRKTELEFINDVHQNEKLPAMAVIFNGIKKGKYGYGYSYDTSYYAQASKPSFRGALKLFLNRF